MRDRSQRVGAPLRGAIRVTADQNSRLMRTTTQLNKDAVHPLRQLGNKLAVRIDFPACCSMKGLRASWPRDDGFQCRPVAESREDVRVVF